MAPSLKPETYVPLRAICAGPKALEFQASSRRDVRGGGVGLLFRVGGFWDLGLRGFREFGM